MEINLGNSVTQLALIHVDRVIHVDLRVKFLAVRPCWSCFRSTSCLSSIMVQHVLMFKQSFEINSDSAVDDEQMEIEFLHFCHCVTIWSFYLFVWLRWVFVAVRGFSLAAASGGYSLLRCAGFSLRWLLLLQSTGSRARAQ